MKNSPAPAISPSEPASAATGPEGAQNPSRTDGSKRSGWLRGAVFVAAAWSLGMSIQVHEGFFTPLAIRYLVASIGLTVLALTFRPVSVKWKLVCDIVFAVALCSQFHSLLTQYPGSLAITDPTSERRQLFNTVPKPDSTFLTPKPVVWGLYASAVVAVLLFAPRPAVVRAAFIALLAIHLAMGFVFVSQTHPPFSDVYLVQRNASAAILEGKNPFEITIPNLFGVKPEDFPIDDQGRIACGYPYPPLTLFLVLPSYLATGDTRYANAVAMTLIGALLGFLRPGRYAKLAALLVLFTPRAFMILEIGFTEVFVALFFVATIFAAVRKGSVTPLLYGLCLGSKQYTVFLAPLSTLLLGPGTPRRRALRFVAIAFGVTALVTIPLMALCWPASRHSIIEAQFRYNPLNQYVLTIPAWALWHFPREQVVRWIPLAFVLAVGVVTWAAVFVRRTPANFCFAASVAYLLFFAFNKQAYSHYYFLTIAMMGAALASSLGQPDEEPAARGDATALLTDAGAGSRNEPGS